MGWFFQSWGKYPPEYDREIHGPYNPTIYYGKRDTPFGNVKIKELVPWLLRRNKSPRALMQALSRTFLRYHLTWVSPKKPNVYFLGHFAIGLFLFEWYLDYGYHKHLKQYKYH